MQQITQNFYHFFGRIRCHVSELAFTFQVQPEIQRHLIVD